MLSPETIAIVKSTAPILSEHGETLTKHFYKRMFTHNPEVAPFFNAANQQAGKQQRALAGAITAYAANIDNLEVLGGAVELIAQKHASLMIKPEHYPIVGENLLASIREVLGAGATDEVINAWGEAYGFLADIMIGREKQIYAENAKKPGGWEGFKKLRVIRKEKESSNITSFYLANTDGAPLPTFKPGQYITVRVTTSSGTTTMRNYSLSDKPGQDWFRISVKREVEPNASTPAGYVSNLLHNSIEVGHEIEVAPPCGEFFLDLTEKHERPLVLLAAGVGITPIMSILLATLDTMADREIIFIHGSLNEGVQAFKNVVDKLAQEHSKLKVHYRYSDAATNERKGAASTGFINAELIESFLPGRDADYYFCGPQPFMVGIYHDLLKWGIPPAQVRFEFFGPRQELEAA
jgi:nitric oxide dioxygenase